MTKQEWGLRYVILLLAIIPALSVAIIFMTQDIMSNHATQEKNLYYKATSTINQTQPSLEYGIATENIAFLHHLSKAMIADPDIIGIRIVNADGLILVNLNETGASTPAHLHWLRDYLYQHRTLHFTDDVVEEEAANDWFAEQGRPQVIGTIHLNLSNRRLNNESYELLSDKVIAFGMILSVVLAVAYRVSRSITSPLERLSSIVGDITTGNLHVKSELGGPYEIGKLQSGFNDMSRQIFSAQKKLEQKINLANKELQEKIEETEKINSELMTEKEKSDQAYRAKSRFIANVSHELRTPLNAIIGYSDMMLGKNNNPQLDNSIKQINSSSKILLSLINDVIENAEIEQEQLTIKNDWFDPAITLAELCDIVSIEAHYKNIHVYSSMNDGGFDRIYFDEKRLRQILTNLISNAIKFTEQGYVLVQQSIQADCLSITIQDTGIGIPEDKLEEIFEPFKQSDESRTRYHGGSGLGLSIISNIIESFGGDIRVERTLEPQGSAFHVRLPLEKQPNAQSNTGKRRRIAVLGDANTPIERIWSPHTAFHEIKFHQADAQADYYVHYVRSRLDIPEADNKQRIILSKMDPSAEQQDGHIWLNPHTDPKTVMKISESTQQVMKRRKKNDSSLPTLRAKRILVVDDNPINRDLFREYLQHDARIFQASSGSEAIAAATKKKLDAILLDIHMPEMDGYQVYQQLAPQLMDVPFLAVTADASKKSKRDLYRHGFHDVITKPVTQKDLIHHLNLSLEALSYFNVQIALKACNGNTSLLREMMSQFRQDCQSCCRLLIGASATSEKRLETLHKLAGSARYCGSTSIEKLSRDLEKGIRQQQDVSSIRDDFFHAVQRYQELTQRYLA